MYYYDQLFSKIQDKAEPQKLSNNWSPITVMQVSKGAQELINPLDINRDRQDKKELEDEEENLIPREVAEEVFNVINRICDEIYDRDPNQIEYVKRFAEFRQIDADILLQNHCFYCTNPNYMEIKFADLNVYREIYHISTAQNTLWKQRFIFPIRDFYGRVYGFVGYDKFSNAKYVEYSNPVYKACKIKALGLDKENIKYILSSKYCIFTEGVMDYYRGRQCGFPIIANLGVKFNPLLKYLIDRLDVVFVAYDNDEAGMKNRKILDSYHHRCHHIVFKPKKTEDGKEIKIDLDEALKSKDNYERLKNEINLRLKHPLKLGEIVI